MQYNFIVIILLLKSLLVNFYCTWIEYDEIGQAKGNGDGKYFSLLNFNFILCMEYVFCWEWWLSAHGNMFWKIVIINNIYKNVRSIARLIGIDWA